MGTADVRSRSAAVLGVGDDVLVTLCASVIDINVSYTPIFLQ